MRRQIGKGWYGIGRFIAASRSPSPDPRRQPRLKSLPPGEPHPPPEFSLAQPPRPATIRALSIEMVAVVQR